MGKILFQILSLLFFVITIHAQVRENSDIIIKTIEKTYTIKYSDTTIDRFIAVYTSHLTSYMRQDGHKSTWRHPIDTRSCFYRVGSYIKREGFFLTGSGKRIPFNDVSKIYGPNTITTQQNIFPQSVLGQHSPCNNCTNDFNNKKGLVKKQILDIFDGFFTNDFENKSNQEISIVIGNDITIIK